MTKTADYLDVRLHAAEGENQMSKRDYYKFKKAPPKNFDPSPEQALVLEILKQCGDWVEKENLVFLTST